MSVSGNKHTPFSRSRVRGFFLDLDDTLYAYDICNEAGKKALFVFLSKKLKTNENRIAQLFAKATQTVKKRIPHSGASHSRLLYIQYIIETTTGRMNFRLAIDAEKVFWQAYLKKMKIRSGVLSFLQKAKAREFVFAVVSDLTTEIQMKKLIKLEVDSYIDFLATSEESGIDKPAANSFRLALEKTGLRPNEVVMIGDNYDKDIVSAEKLGIKGILLCPNGESDKSVVQFDSFREIENYVFGEYDEANANRRSDGRHRKKVS